MDHGHIAALSQKHADLDHRISREMQKPLPDTATLHSLKARKLRIKEEMQGLA